MLPVAHIGASLLSLSIYDKIRKAEDKVGVPSFWFIIIALAGILPDLLKPHLFVTERTSLSHSIFFPLFFLLIYLILRIAKIKFGVYFLLFSVGAFLHLILDMISGVVFIFYPLSEFTFNESILFPAHIRKISGIWYAHLFQHIIWYLFDVFFLGLYIFVDKTDFLEKKIRRIKLIKKKFPQ